MTKANERNTQGQNKPAEKAKQDAADVKKEAQQTASQVTNQAKEEAKNQVNRGRNTAAQEIDKVAHAAKAAASDLNDQDRPGLSNYVSEVAEQMTSLSQSLQSKSVDELVNDVTGLARRNPTLFITGSLAIGLGLARFAKSSSQDHGVQNQGTSQQGSDSSSNTWSDYTGSTASNTSGGELPGAASQRDLYPGYSDADRESRAGTNWPGGSADSSYTAGDYTDRDFPPTENTGLTGNTTRTSDEKDSNRGGKRYE